MLGILVLEAFSQIYGRVSYNFLALKIRRKAGTFAPVFFMLSCSDLARYALRPSGVRTVSSPGVLFPAGRSPGARGVGFFLPTDIKEFICIESRDFSELLMNADAYMYEAKKGRRLSVKR